MKFVCVYKSGGHYGKDYVEKLKEGVNKYFIGIEFICLSDDPSVPGYKKLMNNWDGWWSKMELFRPDIKDDLLYMDLDTVIFNDCAKIKEACLANKGPILLSDFYFPDRKASGVMWLPETCRGKVWAYWYFQYTQLMKDYEREGDQAVIGKVLSDSVTWDRAAPNSVVSYKAHVNKKLVPPHIARLPHVANAKVTEESCVMCYHGKPRPRDTGWSIS